MAEKNAFIIDEDREFAKRVAAALRTDQLKVGIAEGDRDPIEEISLERPDVVLMRADGREGESGFALCSRLKKNRRLSNLPVFLYSADVDSETFEHHRQQDGAADAYIHFPHEPPYPMDDLRARVTEALESRDEEGNGGPPPLPVSREPIKPITDEDTAFLDRVLDSLQQGAIEDPATTIPPGPPPPTSARRTTADAKLDMLRHKLRQREFELAKIMEMYRAKEREYHEWNEKLVEKDVEAQALKVTIEDYQRVADLAQGELDRRTAEFNASFEQLLEEKVTRENELIHTVAIKEKELADLEASLGSTQAEVQRLTEALNSAHATLEETDQAHQTAAAELKSQLDDREGTLASVEQALADTQGRAAELEVRVEGQDRALNQQQEAIVALETLVLDLRNDLADAREALDDAANAHQFELEAYDEIVTGLQTDLDEAEASFAQLESDLRAECAELTVALSTRTERLSCLSDAQRALETANRGLYLEAAARQAALELDNARLAEVLVGERRARADAEAKFELDLQQSKQKAGGLLDSIADLEVVSGERIRVLSEQVDERDRGIHQLREALDEEKKRAREVEARLTQAVSELDARRQGLQGEVDQRLAELAETEAAHTAALAERDAVEQRLEEELRNANDRLASIEVELADARDHADELDRNRIELEADFQRQFQAQAEALASTRESAGVKEAQLREQISHLTADLAGRGEQIDELHAQVEVERRDRLAFEERSAALQAELESARADVNTTRRALQETEEAVHHLRETLAAREGRLTELQEGMRSEHAARQTGEAQLTQLRAENDARNERIGRLEGQVSAQELTIEDLREELLRTRAELESARETAVDLRAQFAASQSSMDERSARLDDSARRLDERDRELSDARRQLAELNAGRDQAWAAKEQVQQQLDEARREWGMVREELMAERQQLGQRVDSLQRDIEALQSARDGLAADNARLSDELEARLQREDQLRADLQAGVDRASAVDRELEAERSARASSEQALERLRSEMANVSMSAQAASESADSQTRELENRLRQLAVELSDANAETDQVRRVMGAELEQSRAQIDALSSQVAALSAARDGLGDEATDLSRRLDDAMARTTALATEKSQLEEQRVADVRRLEQQLRNREESLTEQRADALRLGETIQRLNSELDDLRRERDEVETKYVRELEELHDQYVQKAQQADISHAREVENLRKTAIDAKRELRTTQLATQRLEDRLRRLETDRPSRSDASADFESFIAQFSDQQGAARSGSNRRTRSEASPETARKATPDAHAATAEALASPAVPAWGSDRDDDDVTEVGGRIFPVSPTTSPGLPTAVRSASKTRPDLVGAPPEDPDDFLAAFDKEFEDIKGG